MSRFWKIALIVVVVLVLVGIGFRVLHKSGTGAAAGGGRHRGGQSAAGTNAQDKDKAPVPVTVESVLKQNVPVYLTALGTVQALNTVTVNPQIGGQLMSLNFTEGQEVKKGQVLAQIDPRTLQASLQQAIATKKQNEALLATAQSTYTRSTDPKYSPYVAKIDLDTQRNNVSQYQALVASNEASINSAKVQLGFTTITSPIDGVAGIRGVDVGNVMTTTSAIVTLTQIHPLYIFFYLPEQNFEQVQAAQRAEPLDVAALDRTDNKIVDDGGKLRVIDNQISTSTGTFKLRAQFPNPDGSLWPGEFVNIRLKVRTVDGGLVIPTQAVQRGPDGDYVYLVQADSTVKMQPVVQAGEVGDSHVMISKGLDLGDKVVTEGQFRLKPGSKVQALKPGEVPAEPTPEELEKARLQGDKNGGGGRRGGP